MNNSGDRAALFDAAAVAYDKFRPGYPEQLLDDMFDLACITASSNLLEVGCGTGKATVQVAKRGYAIDCIEPGANLLAIARKNCDVWPSVKFLQGRFELSALRQNHYHLIYSAQAFHWIDQSVRWSLCRKYLQTEGAVAIIHNYSPVPQQGPGKELTLSIEQITKGTMKSSDHQVSIRQWTEEMEVTGIFSALSVRRYAWLRPFTAEEYIGLFTTFSDFLSMTRQQQEGVITAIREIINANGGIYNHQYESVLFEGILAP